MAASLRFPLRIPGKLSITLLGSPSLMMAGEAVPLPRRQMRALLYRLAIALQPVAREQLYFLLWPDIPDAAARRNLTVLLNQLRQSLPTPGSLRTQNDAVQLDSAYFQVDTVDFSEAMARAAQQGDLEDVTAAVALYKGPFLDGFSIPASEEFDAWVAQERRTWERRYLDALAMLVDGFATSGSYPQAIAAAQRALSVDEMAEEMHRRLISLYALSGDRSAALRQFESCVITLERELGVSPLPETRALYESVRKGEAPLRKGAGERLAAQTAKAPLGKAKNKGKNNEVETLNGEQNRDNVSLPAPSTPLIDREHELATIERLITDPDLRLLTLIGPGGSGKSRLALQAAWNVVDHFADGVVFVALAPLRDASLVLLAIGQACGLPQSTPKSLAQYLRNKHMLLLLDNCEHLLSAGPELALLLAAAPALHLLATSRASLNLYGERTFAVPPLPLPDLSHLPAPAALAAIPSVALLLTRTQGLNPNFRLTAENAAEIAGTCVRLDGLPLAIELAAARLKLLAPRDLLRRLDRRLALLTQGSRDLPERHQTLRATIDWSYRLLDVDEQIWFERCSVFVGGWTLSALEGLDAQLHHHQPPRRDDVAFNPASDLLDILAALVDKSLVQANSEGDAETRFTMLETIREFATERLQDRAASDTVALAHATYYLNLVEPWDMNTPGWMANIEREIDNLRAAMRCFLDRDDGTDGALRLGRVLGRFFYWRDWISEGRWWIEQAVTRSEGVRTEARATILVSAALLAMVHGETARSIELHETNLALCQELQLPRQRASSLNALGTIYARQGDYDRAIASFEESLAAAREAGSPEAITSACYMLGGTLIDAGRETERALALYEECLALARQHHLLVTESMTLGALGMARALSGDLARAEELLPEALRMQRELNASMSIAWTYQYLGILAYLQGDYATSFRNYVESLSTTRHGGAQYIVATSLEGLAGIAANRQQPQRAVRLLGAAEASRELLESQRPPIEQAMFDQILTTIRSQLSDTSFHEGWQAGRSLSADEAIAEASASSEEANP